MEHRPRRNSVGLWYKNFLLYRVMLYSYMDGPLFVALVLLSRRGVGWSPPKSGRGLPQTALLLAVLGVLRLSNRLTVLFVNAKPVQAVARPLRALSYPVKV